MTNEKQASKASQFFGKMQKLGQSLMIPVSVLPAAGLVVALGRMLQIQSEETTKAGIQITNEFIHGLGKLLFSSGLAIFEQLPVIFAIGVAIGFTGGAGVAGLSAAAAYFTLANLLKVMTEVRGLHMAINTGVFGGILAGILAATIYRRFHETKLHPVLGFFSGKRLVPIMSVFSIVFVGLALSFVWPPIQIAISAFGVSVTESSFGPAFYAAGKRLLIPVGLHHVYYPSFLYEFGQFITAAGETVRGDSARYFAGDPKSGLFMASEFPIMLFGLPAAALAMVLRAEGKRRKAIAGVMLTAALTSIITGITEPIEFAFIFVAPILFVVHVGLAFVSGVLTQGFDIHLGYTFSASLIDFVVGFFNQKNSMALWLYVGPLIGVLYFSAFYFLIPLLNYKTPGRDEEVTEDASLGNSSPSQGVPTLAFKASRVLDALGGKDNIVGLDACITRLRLTLKNMTAVNENQLKILGAAGVMKTGQNMQVIFGTESDLLKEEIKKIMMATLAAPAAIASTAIQKLISSPLQGKIITMSEVPDATFAQGILGQGIAIQPTNGTVIAPFDGVVANIFRTNHAIGLVSDDGIELLIHVGIDTVKLQGQGFKGLVKNGDRVKKGQKLIEFDLKLVGDTALSLITPIVITNPETYKKITPTTLANVTWENSILTVDL